MIIFKSNLYYRWKHVNISLIYIIIQWFKYHIYFICIYKRIENEKNSKIFFLIIFSKEEYFIHSNINKVIFINNIYE